ncbi:hypothetical protein QOZ80_3BG0277010 [Eleusine coracana subsp. coracana]|nr:hypothetical protein QOZ80_3BG0277010 [Eleusine coracana subsp. coracana]
MAREGETAANGPADPGRSRSTMTTATIEVVTQQGVWINLHGRIENPWNHGQAYGAGFKCGYCPVSNKGGGVTRLREHLAGIQGNVQPCMNVPINVKDLMLNEALAQKTRKRVTHEHRLFIEKEIALAKRSFEIGAIRATNIPLDEARQIEMAIRESLMDAGLQGSSSSPLGRAGSSGVASCSATQQTKLDKFYRSPSATSAPFDVDLARSRSQAQPRVDIMLQGDARERLGKALAKWFHANDIPGKKGRLSIFSVSH